MDKLFRSKLHSALVESGEHVYTASEQYQTAALQAMDVIAEARETLTPSEFEAWGNAEFGTGGARMADGYIVGDLPTAMRKRGMLSQRGRKKGEDADSAANRVNTFLGDCRAIVRAIIENPGFEFGESFRATYRAARGSPPAGENVAKKKGKAATLPGTVTVINAETGRAWIAANLVDALMFVESLMLKAKQTITANALHSITQGLIDAAKLARDAEEKAAKAAKGRKAA